MSTYNIGTYLAHRLEQIGINHYFAVPGDFNLVLLDQFLKSDKLELVGCCNELNAGYAADGYARARGAAAVVFTYTVGGLSAINAVCGSYAEDLPVIAISGGPNTNDAPEGNYLHHTTGELDFRQQPRCFEQVTAEVQIIKTVKDAPRQIDHAIRTALTRRKPVYIEVACNIAAAEVPPPGPLEMEHRHGSDPASLAAAVEAAAKMINGAVKPALVGGVKMRPYAATEEFQKLAEQAECAVAVMPNAKGMFPENHEQFIGTYWGQVSSPGCSEVIESCDCYLFAGPTFNDYTTVGYTTAINPAKLIHAGIDQVTLPGQTFHEVMLPDFLEALAEQVQPNDASLVAYRRIHEDSMPFQIGDREDALTRQGLMAQVQGLLNANSALVVETGDSWFNGQKLTLPNGCLYEFQMQYGSIGWSTGAVLGMAMGVGPERRVVAMIGDGSFQLTAQEISTMIRYETNPIIFLLNNRGYTIEVEIHDGPYNNIKNWEYAQLVDVFNAGEGNGWSTKVNTAGELEAAIEKAKNHDGVAFIECTLDRDDCSKELLQWGSRVATANGRPPKTA